MEILRETRSSLIVDWHKTALPTASIWTHRESSSFFCIWRDAAIANDVYFCHAYNFIFVIGDIQAKLILLLLVVFHPLLDHFTMLRVEHECEIEVKQEDVFSLPGRGFFRKTFDACRRLLMASDKNPGARKYLRSHASIISEKRRHLRNYRYVIHPFSIFRYILSTDLITITLSYIKFIYGYFTPIMYI